MNWIWALPGKKNEVRKIAATYIFSNYQPPIKNGILICEDDGTIAEVVDTGGNIPERAGLEFYSGILVPGFINAHCHLELSHLWKKIPEKKGIGDFIGNINRLRNEETENIETEMQKADRRMWAAGIAAVGDISNSILSLNIKKSSKIFYHTFIETFGFHPDRAERAFEWAKFVQQEFKENKLEATVVPHSPYSVSAPLFQKIREKAEAEKSILSIHNQESPAEAQFYKDGTGPIAKHLQYNLGIDISHWKPSGKSSLVSVLEYLPKNNPLLLVHNTFTQKQNLVELERLRELKKTHFVLCPSSNLYIENQLPPVNLFREEKLNICIGTDSLASNHELSVLEELITLQHYFHEIDLEELFGWSTINGAHALGISDEFGSFEIGKKPGVNLISGIDFRKMKLTETSKVKRLV